MIKTSYDFPPIPIRSMDWSAWFDGEEEDGPIGRGATEVEAVENLLDNAIDDGWETHIYGYIVEYATKGWKAEKEETGQ